MNTPLIISLVVLGLLVLGLVVSASNRKARREEDRQRTLEDVASARAFWKKAEMRGGLLPVETTLILKDGERAYFCERAELIDWDTTRTSTNTPTYNSSDAWKRLDQGMLTITNLRAVFGGRSGTLNFAFPNFLWVGYDRWKLAKLVSVSPRSGGIEVSVENRQRPSGFICTNPLMPWIVANVCARFPDPSKWDGKTIEVDFASIEESI